MEAEGIYSSKRPRKENDGEDVADVNDAVGLRSWQNSSSRIIRVSRISGGKDRHSKVWTAKGLRDRRVRLSVSTAIQFYDLQDRLGLDQPSKAVDWLVKAAAAAIAHLPELDGAFPMPPPALVRPGRAKLLLERSAAEDHQISPLKNTCSSALEMSKCWGKVKECAGERVAKEKERDQDAGHHHHNLNAQSSFTELLIAGGGSASGAAAPTTEAADYGAGFGQKLPRLPLGASTMDYFGLGGISGHALKIPQLAPGYSSLLHFGNNHHMGMGMMAYNPSAAGVHQEMQEFSFMQDHVNPVAAVVPRGDYDLNVSISGFTGFNRGTLQSNSPHHHHIVDNGNLPFFFGAAPPIAAAAGVSSENHYPGSFNGRLQVCNEEHRHSELKGEGKG